VAWLGAAAGVAWIYREVRGGRITFLDLLWAASIWAIGLLLSSALTELGLALVDRIGERSQVVRKNSKWLRMAVFLLSAGGLLAAVIYTDTFGPIAFLGWTVILIFGAVMMILSQDMKTLLSSFVYKPAGLGSWMDLFASADPVPNGPTRIAEKRAIRSVPITNRGSFLGDHTTYWENVDGFVLRVVRACATTAGSAWVASLPAEATDGDQRSAWRASFLTVARWTTAALWVFLLAGVWVRHADRIPLLFGLPAWIRPDSPSARFIALSAAIAVGAWLTHAGLLLVWGAWSRAERMEAVAQGQVRGSAIVWTSVLGSVVGVLLVGTFFVILHGLPPASHFLSPGTWVDWVGPGVGFGVLGALILHIVLRPPDPNRARKAARRKATSGTVENASGHADGGR